VRNRISDRRSRRLAWIACASLLLHGVVLALMPAQVPAPRAEALPSSFVMFESEAPPPPPVMSAQPATSLALPAPVERAARAAVARAASVAQPSPPSDSETQVETSAASAQQSAPARIDLSPRAAALSIAPTITAPDQPALSSDELAAARSRELSSYLHAAARAEVDRLKARQLELRREADGTCHYDGTAIDATILADGGVVFSDKAIEPDVRLGVDEPAERVYAAEEAVAPQRLELGLRVASRAWAAERAWFLRETAGIRRELADAAYELELRAAESKLRAQLDRIWCDDTRSKPDRRRAIYAVWADISGGEIGQRGRAVIVDYVRRHLPAESADAYTPDELTQLAALSKPAQRFDPYAESEPRDAGMQPR
jgi:hypothetical protein